MDSKSYLEILTHLSCLITLGSFLVRDMLLLRGLAILASLVWIGAMVGTHSVIAASLFWNVVFSGINAWQIFFLIRENRAVDFREEEQELFDALFVHFKPGEFVRILRLGEWRNLAKDELLVRGGDVSGGVWILSQGEALVMSQDGVIKAKLRANDLAGEMSFLKGEPASASVLMATEGRAIFWPKERLEHLFRGHPTLRILFHSIISSNLAEKLRR